MTDTQARSGGFETLTLVLTRTRLQPYRLCASRPSESRERGFLTSLQLRTHLTLVVNVPEGLAKEKIDEMERTQGPVTLTFHRRGSLVSWS